MKYNFYKIATLNQGTSYDYNSVMQYHRYVTYLVIFFKISLIKLEVSTLFFWSQFWY